MLIEFGVLGCILQYFELKLTDTGVHVTIPNCLRAWDGVDAVPESSATGRFGFSRLAVAQVKSRRWVQANCGLLSQVGVRFVHHRQRQAFFKAVITVRA